MEPVSPGRFILQISSRVNRKWSPVCFFFANCAHGDATHGAELARHLVNGWGKAIDVAVSTCLDMQLTTISMGVRVGSMSMLSCCLDYPVWLCSPVSFAIAHYMSGILHKVWRCVAAFSDNNIISAASIV